MIFIPFVTRYIYILINFCSMNTENDREWVSLASITTSDGYIDSWKVFPGSIERLCRKLSNYHSKIGAFQWCDFLWLCDTLHDFSQSPLCIIYIGRQELASILPNHMLKPDNLVGVVVTCLRSYIVSSNFYEKDPDFVLQRLVHIFPYCWNGEWFNDIVSEILLNFITRWYVQNVTKYWVGSECMDTLLFKIRRYWYNNLSNDECINIIRTLFPSLEPDKCRPLFR